MNGRNVAKKLNRARAKGWSELLPLDTIDRQSPQDFARWGRTLGQVLGTPLELAHRPVLPATETLTLVSRRDYGAEVQAPTAILRFALPKATQWRRLTGAAFARFTAGDLIGILPEGSPVPRLYSLASARSDKFVEIVVKRQPGGLCSGQLTALEPGQVAIQLTEKDALGAHSRDELGISETVTAHPIQAALVSAATFAVGAVIPLIIAALVPSAQITLVVAVTTLIALSVLGGLGASVGGAGIVKGAVRVTFWGALAMGATAVVGMIFGVTVG